MQSSVLNWFWAEGGGGAEQISKAEVGEGETLRATVHVAFSAEERPSYRWEGEWISPDGDVVARFVHDEATLFGASD